jgi:hypothetical protein
MQLFGREMRTSKIQSAIAFAVTVPPQNIVLAEGQTREFHD